MAPAGFCSNSSTVVIDGSGFATLGVPILQGRNFAPTDTPTSPGVAIVNEAMARKYWPSQNAVGKRLRVTTFNGRELEVVGVSADAKYDGLKNQIPPTMLMSYRQRPVGALRSQVPPP